MRTVDGLRSLRILLAIAVLSRGAASCLGCLARAREARQHRSQRPGSSQDRIGRLGRSIHHLAGLAKPDRQHLRSARAVHGRFGSRLADRWSRLAEGCGCPTDAPSGQAFPVIVSDGVGGAIVAWQDGRSQTSGVDIYAQHVLASGAVDLAWPANGRVLCTATGGQLSSEDRRRWRRGRNRHLDRCPTGANEHRYLRAARAGLRSRRSTLARRRCRPRLRAERSVLSQHRRGRFRRRHRDLDRRPVEHRRAPTFTRST